MGFTIEAGIPAITVFFQGLLSFFSPCVLPLLPLYIGYLSGGTGIRGEDGKIYYKRSKVMMNTLFFVIGISFAFFLLGFGFSTAGKFFGSNQMLFTRIGGILIVMFGLYQLGIFGTSSVLGQERRLPLRLDKLAMTPVTALIFGFTFSFAWTPCVGPALASVLLMAASAKSAAAGFLLIGVYTLGFVLPFLAVGLFTTTLLEMFKKYKNVVKYTVKAGGVLMIFLGIMMVTGWMNQISGYLSGAVGNIGTPVKTETTAPEPETSAETTAAQTETVGQTETAGQTESTEAEQAPIPAPDFTLTDQFGTEHTLSDYKGKTVFLNFWATWCPPCRNEMPDIQKIYEDYGLNEEDLVVLGVAGPGIGGEVSEEEITAFLEENGYTYPVVMDPSGELFMTFGITAYPTTFMIDKDGAVFGYVSGQLSETIMTSIIQQTMDQKMAE